MTQGTSWGRGVLRALGLVFGDIGTSPIYTLTVVVALTVPTEAHILGVLSLIVWTLILLVTVEYAWLAMSLGKHGEGGTIVLSEILMPLLRGGQAGGLRHGPDLPRHLADHRRRRDHPGDLDPLGGRGAPARPRLRPGRHAHARGARRGHRHRALCRAAQRHREDRGLVRTVDGGLVRGPRGSRASPRSRTSPASCARSTRCTPSASSPRAASPGFLILSEVILCATGGEALYADMGHLKREHIIHAWSFRLRRARHQLLRARAPSSSRHPNATNVLFEMVFDQAPLLYIPFLLLSIAATVIASQAMISGMFSIVYQGITTRILPMLKVKYTSHERQSQIYIGAANWFLLLAVLVVMVLFQQSHNLAAAYGLAVTGTMTITGVMMTWIFTRRRQPARAAVAALRHPRRHRLPAVDHHQDPARRLLVAGDRGDAARGDPRLPRRPEAALPGAAPAADGRLPALLRAALPRPEQDRRARRSSSPGTP